MDLLLNPEINFCSCGCEARLIKNALRAQKTGKKRFNYWVECLDDSCGNIGKTEGQSWKAILSWNSSENSDFPDILEIPFLPLIGLNQEEIVAKISNLVNELNTKANKTYKSGRPLPQKAYIELKAKIAWLDYAKAWYKDHFNCADIFTNKDQQASSDDTDDNLIQQSN